MGPRRKIGKLPIPRTERSEGGRERANQSREEQFDGHVMGIPNPIQRLCELRLHVDAVLVRDIVEYIIFLMFKKLFGLYFRVFHFVNDIKLIHRFLIGIEEVYAHSFK